MGFDAALPEPLLHLLELGLLRELHPLGQERDVRAGAPPGHPLGHQDRLAVVVDHRLHELDVRLGVLDGRRPPPPPRATASVTPRRARPAGRRWSAPPPPAACRSRRSLRRTTASGATTAHRNPGLLMRIGGPIGSQKRTASFPEGDEMQLARALQGRGDRFGGSLRRCLRRASAQLPTTNDPRVGLAPGFENPGVAANGIRHLANRPKPPGFSDPSEPGQLRVPDVRHGVPGGLTPSSATSTATTSTTSRTRPRRA